MTKGICVESSRPPRLDVKGSMRGESTALPPERESIVLIDRRVADHLTRELDSVHAENGRLRRDVEAMKAHVVGCPRCSAASGVR